jgi:hypothetical protein
MSFQEIDRNAILDDEHQQRLRRIKLIERETAEQAPIWAAKQATLFPTALPLSQTPTLGQIITEEVQKNAYDADVLYQRAEQKINTIADKTNAEYILDRLENEDLFYLVNSWDGIVKKLRDEYSKSGLDKAIFIDLIKTMRKTFGKTFNPDNELTEKGQQRLQQKADLEREQRAKAADEKEMQLNQKGMFDEEVNERQRAKEEADLKQEQERLRKEKVLNTYAKLKKFKEENKAWEAKKAEDKADGQVEIESRENDFIEGLQNMKIDKTPFKYSLYNLPKDIQKEYNNNINTSIKPIVKALKHKNEIVKLIYEKYPEKMTFIRPQLTDEQKIIDFLALDAHDQLVDQHEKYQWGDEWEEEEEKTQEPDYEAIAQGEVVDLVSKYEIEEYMKTHNIKKENLDLNTIFVKAKPLDIKRAIIRERAKQLKVEATEGQTPPPTTTTTTAYESEVADEIRDKTKNALLEYAEFHNLDLNVSKKAKKADIQAAIIQERTKQLTKPSTYTESLQSNVADMTKEYVKQAQNEIKNLQKVDLLEYAFEHNIQVNRLMDKATIRKVIIKERAMQLSQQQSSGSGLKKRRRIVGRGYSSSDEEKPIRKNTVPKKIINGKYIDLNKLKINILTVRYVKTGGYIPTIKAQHISNDVKSVIEDIISNRFEKRLFDKLETNEKRLIKRLITALKIDIDISSKEEDEYRRQFDILLGEMRAGNNNPDIKNKLKQYVVESMNSGMLTRREAFQLLYELTINN